MISFSHDPPVDDRGHGLPLIRTPATTPLIAAITCDRLIGLPTHFWGGRTIPCDTTKCEPCLAGAPWRWHGYVSGFDHRNSTHFLFEMTKQASQQFKDWWEKHRTLRGAKFMATRLHRRINGRVLIQLKSIDLIEFPIPDPPDILSALSIIWNVPLADFFEAVPVDGQATVGADRDVSAHAAEWAYRLKQHPNAKPPTKANGELITIDDAAEVAEALAKVRDGNGRQTTTTEPNVHD